MYTFHSTSYGEGKYQIWGSISGCKKGISITIFGGEAPHVGCVVIAIPRPSLNNESKLSTTTSTINVVGHKDDIIAKKIARKVALKFNVITTVTAGVHVNDANRKEIDELINNSVELTQQLIKNIATELG